MKKFDRKVWIFILVAAFGIPGYYQLRGSIVGNYQPYYFFIVGVIFSFVVSLMITYVNMVILGRYFDKVLPWQNIPAKINRRLLLESLITSISAGLIISLLGFSMEMIFPSISPHNRAQVYFDNISVALIVNLIALSIIEGNSIYIMWRESLLHTEKLKRENIESQFAVLKNQVNPHFLFNSLNVLSSLVLQSPVKAQEFIIDFSKIYRYIFDVGDETVVEVRRELDFISSYIALQQKRYGDNLQLDVNVSGEKLNNYIPVLSLQILVENAITHNEISGSNPLLIEIYNEESRLIVKNNYQPRQEKHASLGIGLKNLKERYTYLSSQEPFFIRKEQEYYASLPLLTVD